MDSSSTNLYPQGADDAPFLAQADGFVEYFSRRFPSPSAAPTDARSAYTTPLRPIVLEDATALSEAEQIAIRDEYYSERGIAFFVAKRIPDPNASPHPLVALTAQLAGTLELEYPIAHPKEQGTSEKGMSSASGGVKVYDHGTGQTFSTSTNADFALHQDGLGSTGAVRTVALYMESPPIAGGYNCFQNLARVALQLFMRDRQAFRKLFLPDAITITRPSGNRSIRVTGPVLYLDDEGRGRVNFVGVSPDHPSDDYKVNWSSDSDARRGLEFMLRHGTFFAPGSTFCHMDRPGSGVIFDNTDLIHGRTRFIDAPELGVRRMVLRKWFASTASTATYRHAPGLRLPPDLSKLRPDLFGSELLEGEWRYSSSEGGNVRVG
jgi:hypothetical protein